MRLSRLVTVRGQLIGMIAPLVEENVQVTWSLPSGIIPTKGAIIPVDCPRTSSTIESNLRRYFGGADESEVQLVGGGGLLYHAIDNHSIAT